MRPAGQLLSTLAAAALLAGPAAAQDVTIDTNEHNDYGTYLIDGEGMALYLFENDTQGNGEDPVSECREDCLDAWPPLMANDQAEIRGEAQADLVGVFEREDGQMQVTYNGWPLYHFAQDQEPGETAGQGANDVWYVVSPEGEAVREAEERPDDDNDGNGNGGDDVDANDDAGDDGNGNDNGNGNGGNDN